MYAPFHSCRPTKAGGEENDSRQDLSVQRAKKGMFEILQKGFLK